MEIVSQNQPFPTPSLLLGAAHVLGCYILHLQQHSHVEHSSIFSVPALRAATKASLSEYQGHFDHVHLLTHRPRV